MDGAVARLLGPGDAIARRADARRNAERLIDAARAAVDEVGVAVTAHEIARRAGVGIGTFYRRMPSREALLEAVLADTIDEMIAVAREAREHPDPWLGFCAFAEKYALLRATSCGLNEALGGSGGLMLEEGLGLLRKEFRGLVGQARRAGKLRPDVTWQDVAFALASVVPGDHTLGITPRDGQWRKNLRIILAGLRAV